MVQARRNPPRRLIGAAPDGGLAVEAVRPTRHGGSRSVPDL